MISYAISVSVDSMTEAWAEAFRRAKLRNVELGLTYCPEKAAEMQTSLELTRSLIREGAIRISSVHLPFYGGNVSWDPSEPDEKLRREVVGRFRSLLRTYADLIPAQATLHASGCEPPLSEHPARIDQVCRSIEELLPLAREMKFSFNLEYLPRTCIGNCAEELQTITRKFDPELVGICFDVNHAMARWREVPDLITKLAPRVRAFHLSDYDGVDERHWFPGQGILDWPAVMKAIRAVDHDVLLIHETVRQLCGGRTPLPDPLFHLRQTEASCWFLEHCESVVPRIREFPIPGNL